MTVEWSVKTVTYINLTHMLSNEGGKLAAVISVVVIALWLRSLYGLKNTQIIDHANSL